MTRPGDDPNEHFTLDGDLRIGDFLVRPVLKKVIHQGADGEAAEEFSLPDKAMGVLVYLAEHAHQVCRRDEILNAVWGEDREAYDRVLDTAIAEIRRGFGDEARKPSFVQTVPKRGYRLLVLPRSLAPTRSIDGPNDVSTSRSEPGPSALGRIPLAPGSDTRTRWIRAAILAACLTASLWAAWRFLPAEPGVRARFESTSNLDAALVEQLREGVVQDHPCVEKNLLRPSNWLRGDDFVVSVSSGEVDRDSSLRAIIQSTSSNWKLTTLSAKDLPDSDVTTAMIRNVRAALDEGICNAEFADSEEHACHCLSAAMARQTMQRPDQAAELLDRAVRLDPDLLAAYEAMIPVLFNLGESQRVTSALRSGLERLGSLESDIAIQLRRRLAQVQHDHGTEWDMIQTMATRYPEDQRWKMETAGFLNRNRNDCQAALDILQPLAANDPADLKIQFETVKALLRCERTDEGVDILKSIVAVSGRRTEARLWLAIAYTTMGRWDEAQSLAQEVLALQPNNPVSYWLLGSIARAQGRHSETLRWANTAEELAKWPQDKMLVDDLVSSTSRHLGDFETCLESTKNYRGNTGPWGYTPIYERGFCLLDAGRMEAARELLRYWETLHATRNSSWEEWLLLAYKGAIEARSVGAGGSVDLAAKYFEDAVALQSPGPVSPYLAAEELERAGDHERAETLYELVLSRTPGHPWTHCRLGLLRRDEGRLDEAIAHMHVALDVFGNPPEDPLGIQCAEALAELDPNFAVAN